MSNETEGQRTATLHAVRDAYGGDPNDPSWDTPEGIAAIIEDLSGQARANASRYVVAEMQAEPMLEALQGLTAIVEEVGEVLYNGMPLLDWQDTLLSERQHAVYLAARAAIRQATGEGA